MNAAKQSQEMMAKNFYKSMTGLGSATSKVGGKNVVENTYQTTNQVNFQKYNIQHYERPETCKPRVDTVVTGGVKKDFDSY